MDSLTGQETPNRCVVWACFHARFFSSNADVCGLGQTRRGRLAPTRGGRRECIARNGEGQQVAADQPLLRLSPVRANSNLQQGQSKLQALKAAAARLQAEANGETKVAFPADVDPEFQRLEMQAFMERATRFAAEQQALKQQAAQRQAELSEAQGRAKSFAAELDISRKQAALLESLWRKGAASELEQLDAQGRVERLNTQLRDVTNAIPRLQSAISEVQARIQEAVARTKADARSELNQTTAEIARFEAAVSEDSDRLDRTEVRSPVAGYINRLLVNTIGGVIRPGDPVLEITPKDELLTVEARVRPDDRATLRPGLPAHVKIGAYDFATYGALSAHVLEVSADTLPDENSQRYYRILVQAERAQGALAKQIILPGMTTQVDVVVGQRSVLSYLLSPLMRFSSEAFREPR